MYSASGVNGAPPTVLPAALFPLQHFTRDVEIMNGNQDDVRQVR